ncbi:alpha/beta hydrolase [Proteiniphilum acetatigenes]|uniref:alpha/beta hydrolase n=1 Tax=Proteiniphilum acetatigenes TaxID=294710 RepID=UPI000364B51D|nr:alpha/beta hydrolase [Proteiniphilum acetatigenes]SFK66241.1 alpha/beta hydrolase fold [Porphyromonadaceae bacterium KH3CP3RA]
MINKLLLFSALLFLTLTLFGQTVQKETRLYAEKTGQELRMDIYKSDSTTLQPQPCLLFVFGGGFKNGERAAELYHPFFNYFVKKGFTVVSIDYRLGMKDQKAPGVFNTKPLRNAIAMAVDDLYSATNYLLENARELHIDPSLIIISGSSAGAITVLQADYENRDNHPSADVLPDDFRYAGVISFAGAIFSTEGVPSYTQPPAPTLFFHGTADRLVPYDKTRFFNLGMFGSKPLAKKFRSERYPYMFYSIEDIGHEVSEYPMQEFLPEIDRFISDYVFNGKQWMTDIHFKDMLRKSDTSTTPGNYYN